MIDLDIHLPAVQRGDSKAFGKWLAGAEGHLRASLRSFATTVDTEAVLQEAALRVWQVASRFTSDGEPNSLLRWSLRVAKNLALSEHRRLRAHPSSDERADEAVGEGILVDSSSCLPDPLLRAAIAECREQLPRQPLRVLDERLMSRGREPDEVLAERLSMRLNTFLQNFTRARRLLARCLQARGIDVGPEIK
jgi:DNA-directed RNA polymerase specialized sigma24 family protein